MKRQSRTFFVAKVMLKNSNCYLMVIVVAVAVVVVSVVVVVKSHLIPVARSGTISFPLPSSEP